jgi:hypothetical protein
MEFQETNKSQPETSGTDNTPDPNQPQQESNTTGETPEADTPADKELKNEIINSGSSETSEETKYDQNSAPNAEGNYDAEKESLESPEEQVEQFPKEKKIGLIDQAKNTFKSMLGMSPTNEQIYTNLFAVHKWLYAIYDGQPDTQFEYSEIKLAYENIQPALDLINRLLNDKEKLRQQLTEKERDNESLSRENRKLEKICQDWDREYKSLDKELSKITAERNNFSPVIGRYQAQIDTLQKELNSKISNYHQQINNKNEEVETLKKENQTLVKNLAELETSKGKLLAEVASVKRNTGTHYDGTSDRPQHHVLTGEYKTLKEQHLDPLANSLFKLMATSNPELKQQRREKVNDIKADISAIVLIGGQAMMRGESTSSAELPSEKLNKMLEFFNQELGIFDPNQSPQVSELLTKAANVAQGKGQYSVPGKWQEDDFKQAIRELTEKLCQKLYLNFTYLNQDIQTEIQQSINNALIFLQRANLADTPAFLSLESEGAPFRLSYHEAAKGYNDEGIIIKAIYPVYLVNSEAKVKAIVTTEPLTSTASKTPETSTNNTSSEILSLTGTSSNYSASETKSEEISADGKEKNRLQIILETRRATLIKSVKIKWVDNPSYVYYKDNANILLETLSNIEDIQIIEELESAVFTAYDFQGFQEKVNLLVR